MRGRDSQKRRASHQPGHRRRKVAKNARSQDHILDETDAVSHVQSSCEESYDNGRQLQADCEQAGKRSGNSARQAKSRAARALLKESKLPVIDWQLAELGEEFTGKQALDMKFARSLAALCADPTTSNLLRRQALEIRKARAAPRCLLEGLRQPPRYDVDLPTDGEDFRAILLSSFNVIWASAEHKLARICGWSIKRQVEHVAKQTGQAYRPSARPGPDNETTHTISGADLVRMFLGRGPIYPEDAGTNVLDLCRPSGYDFTPTEILEVDLVYRIRARLAQSSAKRGGWSRSAAAGASDTTHSPRSEWMILTFAPSASPFHVDQAGYCTCIVGLEGQKIWCVPRGRWEPNADLFHSLGPFGRAYPQGIGAVSIGPGDLVVQAPGTIHAVHTPRNALIAGRFFWTAVHFARTIKCIRLSHSGKLHSNEDMGNEDYENLNLVINNLDLPGLFTETQLCDVFLEVRILLVDYNYIGLEEDAERYHKVMGQSNLHKSDKHWSRFLYACQKWWWRRYERQMNAVQPVEEEIDNDISGSGIGSLPPQSEPRPRTQTRPQSIGEIDNTRVTNKRPFRRRRGQYRVGGVHDRDASAPIASPVFNDEDDTDEDDEFRAYPSDSDID